ncbi:spore protein [Paenibacillus darwinianus]|nr:alpha/beta-type small acid-soluble spore protein [Paenibacillus darwinianus]EXX86808.1 spore protein [Paenibacillus darwinianus]
MPRRSRNIKVVPESKQALEQMKYEIAAELGLVTPGMGGSDYSSEFAGELGAGIAAVGAGQVQWANLATRDAGAVGGMITRRLIQQAEQALGRL